MRKNWTRSSSLNAGITEPVIEEAVIVSDDWEGDLNRALKAAYGQIEVNAAGKIKAAVNKFFDEVGTETVIEDDVTEVEDPLDWQSEENGDKPLNAYSAMQEVTEGQVIEVKGYDGATGKVFAVKMNESKGVYLTPGCKDIGSFSIEDTEKVQLFPLGGTSWKVAEKLPKKVAALP